TISAIGLWFLNLIGQQIHLHVPYNPITIGVTGLLGIPGLIAILVLHTWIVH
ncbi:MAG: SigmaK-factor processing regulatory protein BofA, partial [Bacilli bacterium]|nr:SigmaK-factor processing regulatory protein BofA [Bacilli bacterium]